MLPLEVKGQEYFNQVTQEFVWKGPPKDKPKKLHLEHSLISISKWESIWKIPFLSDKEKTKDQILSYINCMSLDGDIDQSVLDAITQPQLDQVIAYIQDKKTASNVTNRKKSSGRKEILTSELIYYYMSQFGLPFFAEKWHLSRLLMLIEIANAKGEGGNAKMSKREVLEDYRKINEANKRRFHTKG